MQSLQASHYLFTILDLISLHAIIDSDTSFQ